MIELYYWPTPNGHKTLKRWFQMIRARPAVVRAYEKGASIGAKPVVDEDAKKFLFGQNAETVRAGA